ncbi:BON domain-containing protein [Frateuria hangzhouensis]|uniref:BON domain-containing protein n=1 Tax=Frateuria hangzhouensis TaxID=2995589 RepID=UPI0022609AE0|nr:BON domain-containing protein [Frateuria sp. STR12]MCX7514725.1 BON domain-containing protein [Frateuria sp. STR12]
MKLALPSLAAVGLVAAVAASSGALAQQSPPPDHPVTGQDADNTGTNERDRNDRATLPMDQSNASADVDLVANVRQAIVGDGNLSVKARNVKVIANGGVVTLRGPVADAQEKARIQQLASGVQGVQRVDNRLDIETDQSH